MRSHSSYHLPPGSTIRQGKYRIESVLGEGGFGITYRGLDLTQNRRVAIKENWPEKAMRQGKTVIWPLSVTPQARLGQLQKFADEAQCLFKCRHPGIVQVYDWFEENETAYVVMALISGRPLSKILEKEGPPTPRQAKQYFLQLAEALQMVHHTGLLHRDIKPDNILINHQERAILIDFGAAKEFIAGQTQDMSVTLTPGYAPIEQYSYRKKRWPATDIYALCASMYHITTGHRPIPAAERFPPDPLIPPRQWGTPLDPWVEQVILKGLQMRIKDRLQTVTELLKMLTGGCQLAKLVAVSTDAAISEFFLDQPQILIGRLEHSKTPIDINLDPFQGATTVSRHHAEIYQKAGHWLLRDLQSSNGTFIIKRQGQRHTSHRITRPERLRSGDEVAFGKVRFSFQQF